MYEIEWADNGVYWKYFGDISGREIIEASQLIYNDSRFAKIKYKLVDFLDIDSISLSKEEAAEIVGLHKAAALSNDNIEHAVVTSSNGELANKFACFFSNLCCEFYVFQDRAKGNNWLSSKCSC
jgi:hypothetical protein